jgi:hypothetical protein
MRKTICCNFGQFSVQMWGWAAILSIFNFLINSGPPRQERHPRPGPCLDFGFQYPNIRNFGVEYWALPGSNSRAS